jgi:hypothetical protein
MNTRYLKGIVLCVSRRILQVHGEAYKLKVESERTDGKFYDVDLIEKTCNCPDFVYRNVLPCKHLEAGYRFKQ